jgi:hypothetical protein
MTFSMKGQYYNYRDTEWIHIQQIAEKKRIKTM